MDYSRYLDEADGHEAGAALAVTAVIAASTGSLFEGSAAALLLIALLFVAYNVFGERVGSH